MEKTFESELNKLLKQSKKLQTCSDDSWDKESSKFYKMVNKFFLFTKEEVSNLDDSVPEYAVVMKLFGFNKEKVLTRVGERVWEKR